MKKLLTIALLSGLISCERSLTPDISNIGSPVISSVITPYEDQIGKTIYNHIRLHSDIDPYTHVSTEQAAVLKKAFADLKERGISDPNKALDLTSTSQLGKVSAVMVSNLKQFNNSTHQFFAQMQTFDVKEVDKWFADQIESTRERTDINSTDKTNLLIVQSAVRYGVKARLEAIYLPYNSKNGRAMSIDFGCIAQEAQCVANTLATYAGYGATVGTAYGGPAGTAGGTTVGVVIGSLVSVATCQCQQNTQPCQFPKNVVIPPQCLSSGDNLQVRVLGYGENPSGFELEIWDTADRQNRLTAPLQDASQGNVFYVNSATLQGRTKIYVLPVTNCGGDRKYSPAIYEFNLVDLAKPTATLYGPTDVSVGSTVTYSINGFNYNSIRWELFSNNVGTILSQQSGSVQVRWDRPIGSPNAVYAKVRNNCSQDDVTFSIPVNVH